MYIRVLSASCSLVIDLMLLLPPPAELQCVVPTVYRVQPPAVLPALPPPLLPSAASPLWRQPNWLLGMFYHQCHPAYLNWPPSPCILAATMVPISAHHTQIIFRFLTMTTRKSHPSWLIFLFAIHWHPTNHRPEWKQRVWPQRLISCSQEEEECLSLAVCLGLLPSAPPASNNVHSASCLEWAVSAFDLVSQWCAEVKGLSQMPAEQSLVCLNLSQQKIHVVYDMKIKKT